jgi:hypothetical protein
MQLYSYAIRLQIWHPNIAPDLISHSLGLQPNRSWEAGKQRCTPKGTPLEGTYRESYWYADPFARGEYSSTDDRAEDTLIEVLELIEPKQKFLQTLRSGGGRIVVQVSSYSGRNYTLELSPETLIRYANLGVSLAHDVYPYAQNW